MRHDEGQNCMKQFIGKCVQMITYVNTKPPMDSTPKDNYTAIVHIPVKE